MARVTISDIAATAGVSKGAVSYALNGKPGVSTATRARVLRIAHELGWTPSQAARSLSTSRADAIALVLNRPARLLGLEPFYMEFIAGIEDVIASRGVALMLHLVESAEQEVAAYEKWWAQGRVDGILLVDLRHDDSRVGAVERLGVPAIAVSDGVAAQGLPHVSTDDDRAMRNAVRYLARLGHRRIARVGGLPSLAHTVIRDRSFRAETEAHGIADAPIFDTDFSGEGGARATRALLMRTDAPTAIIYDNDVMAVAGLGVASEFGVRVPSELSLLAWDDSSLCEITNPALSAMSRDVTAFGALAAEMLMTLIDRGEVENRQGAVPTLLPRGSTAAAPRT